MLSGILAMGFSDPFLYAMRNALCALFLTPAIWVGGCGNIQNTTTIYKIVANLQPLNLSAVFFMRKNRRLDMNKHIIALAAIGIASITIQDTMATTYLPTCCSYDAAAGGGTGCQKITCNGTVYEDCTTCANGSTPEQTTVVPCGSAFGSLTYGKCENTLIDPPILDTPCPAGQYKSLDKTIGNICVDCPTPGTSEQGAKSITKCFIPAGTTVSDTTGTYKYTEDCYYNNNINPIK